jgi:hypothetical protein
MGFKEGFTFLLGFVSGAFFAAESLADPKFSEDLGKLVDSPICYSGPKEKHFRIAPHSGFFIQYTNPFKESESSSTSLINAFEYKIPAPTSLVNHVYIVAEYNGNLKIEAGIMRNGSAEHAQKWEPYLRLSGVEKDNSDLSDLNGHYLVEGLVEDSKASGLNRGTHCLVQASRLNDQGGYIYFGGVMRKCEEQSDFPKTTFFDLSKPWTKPVTGKTFFDSIRDRDAVGLVNPHYESEDIARVEVEHMAKGNWIIAKFKKTNSTDTVRMYVKVPTSINPRITRMTVANALDDDIVSNKADAKPHLNPKLVCPDLADSVRSLRVENRGVIADRSLRSYRIK